MTRSARFALVVPLAVFVLAGCGGAPAPAPAPAPASPAAAAPAVPAAGKPSAADSAAFVAQARKIAPKLVGDDERIATRGANSCDSIKAGPAEKATDQAVQRFSSGSYTVTRAEAAKLVEAARSTVCKS